jgi:multicomponent Na+:H+ antiporter subunit E
VVHHALRPVRILYAIAFFVYELVLANLRLAWDVAVPGRLPQDLAIIRVDTDARTDGEVWLVANAISMTPGTLTLEADREHGALYIHTLYGADREAFTRQMAAFERVLLGALR